MRLANLKRQLISTPTLAVLKQKEKERQLEFLEGLEEVFEAFYLLAQLDECV